MESPPTSDNQAPAPSAGIAKFRVKFADGPAAGMTREYDKERPTFKVFAWTYESTGRRDGDFWLYVRKHKSRIGQRIIARLANQTGSDPRLLPKTEPTKVIHRGRNDDCWCGSGRKFKRCHASTLSN